jgi:SAM-dependent methyltransferase
VTDGHWRGSQAAARARHLARFDAAETDRYHQWVGQLNRQQQDAYLADLGPVFQLRAGLSVLDAGAGTGTLCGILLRQTDLSVTALEPVPAMLARLRGTAALQRVTTVEGFCDSIGDRVLFPAGRFDAIVSRQLVNGLFDPLAAFRNWHHWLSPRGTIVVIDGLYDRSAWQGGWEEEVDVLPLSTCQSTAVVPYLLEVAGFRIDAVQRMESVNALPTTRTPRYVVAASK